MLFQRMEANVIEQSCDMGLEENGTQINISK